MATVVEKLKTFWLAQPREIRAKIILSAILLAFLALAPTPSPEKWKEQERKYWSDIAARYEPAPAKGVTTK